MGPHLRQRRFHELFPDPGLQRGGPHVDQRVPVGFPTGRIDPRLTVGPAAARASARRAASAWSSAAFFQRRNASASLRISRSSVMVAGVG